MEKIPHYQLIKGNDYLLINRYNNSIKECYIITFIGGSPLMYVKIKKIYKNTTKHKRQIGQEIDIIKPNSYTKGDEIYSVKSDEDVMEILI